MTQSEPDFAVLEYLTITKDSRTRLVIALGGTQKAAGILQRNGFLHAPGPGASTTASLTASRQERRTAALLAAGYSVPPHPCLATCEPENRSWETVPMTKAPTSRSTADP